VRGTKNRPRCSLLPAPTHMGPDSPMGGGSDKNRSLTPFEIAIIYVSNLWGRMSFRLAILLGVCLQNAGYTLIRKYSTLTENVSSKEILLVAEAMKVVVGASPPTVPRGRRCRLFDFILTHSHTHHTLCAL
jgi:hypothetical protein